MGDRATLGRLSFEERQASRREKNNDLIEKLGAITGIVELAK